MELPNNQIKIRCGGKIFYQRSQKILVFLFYVLEPGFHVACTWAEY